MSKLLFTMGVWVHLVILSQAYSLVLEEKVTLGQFVELNSEASIWLRCEASSNCSHNIQAEALAKVVAFKSPRLTIEFKDGTQAWLKATSDGFEGMYPTSYESFPEVKTIEEDPELQAELIVKQQAQDSILKETQKCLQLKGPKFEGLGFGCQMSIVEGYLKQHGLKYTKLSKSRIGLIRYKLKERFLNIQLVFNLNQRFSGVEYHFDLEDQRKFKAEVVPQLKWLSKLFSQGLGQADKTSPLKIRSLKEDQVKPYKTWEKKGYQVEVVFGKTDGQISASGFIKHLDLYLERQGKDVLNLDPKEAVITEDDSAFSDFDQKPVAKPAPNVGSTEVPEDFDDW